MDPYLYIAAMESKILELVGAAEKGPADSQHDLHSYELADKNSKDDIALHIAARIGDTLLLHLVVNDIQDYSSEAILADKNEDGNTALMKPCLVIRKKYWTKNEKVIR
ncbi:hypothetical protein DITRI_Ditri01bG0121800 [Diplodiscus trichospermus]